MKHSHMILDCLTFPMLNPQAIGKFANMDPTLQLLYKYIKKKTKKLHYVIICALIIDVWCIFREVNIAMHHVVETDLITVVERERVPSTILFGMNKFHAMLKQQAWLMVTLIFILWVQKV